MLKQRSFSPSSSSSFSPSPSTFPSWLHFGGFSWELQEETSARRQITAPRSGGMAALKASGHRAFIFLFFPLYFPFESLELSLFSASFSKAAEPFSLEPSPKAQLLADN